MSFDPAQLAALAAISRHGSFERAALFLGVTPSAISQRIKALEDRFGTALIARGTPCVPTEAGARLAQHAEDVALLEANVLTGLLPANDAPPPHVRLAVNADSLATWLMPALVEATPLLFELVIDDQDHSANWLKKGAVSAAITSHAAPIAGCDCVDLGGFRYIATASPTFMAKWFKDGVTNQTLAAAPMMSFNVKDRLQHRWISQLTGHKLNPPTHYMASTHAFVDGAMAGLGWGMNPEPLVRTHIHNGTLVELVEGQALDIPLFWQANRLMARALAPVQRAIKSAARDQLSKIITKL